MAGKGLLDGAKAVPEKAENNAPSAPVYPLSAKANKA
jgi:hypothetical protein